MKACGPYVAMIVIQFANAGASVLNKIALNNGLNTLVLVAYRHLVAMILLLPFAILLERKQRTLLSFSLIMKIFVLSSLGTTIHLNIFYTGLKYVSPTVAGALNNAIPALTFAIAVIVRMEEVKIRNRRSQAKLMGTVICIGGALLFTFWKGGFLLKAIVKEPLVHHIQSSQGSHRNYEDNWIKGSALILFSHIAYSAWLILQAVVTKVYPAPISLNVLICFFAVLQCTIVAPFLARDFNLWKLHWNLTFFTIVYSGSASSAMVYFLQTWCISIKGPVFAAMFYPLALVIVAIFSAITFAERLHFSSLIGAFLITLGLYCVLWGKSLENAATQQTQSGKAIEEDSTMQEVSVSINEDQEKSRDTTTST